MSKLILVCALAAGALAFGAATSTATGPVTLTVDDDKAECAAADFTSIQAAVNAADPGSVIRVCPGLYAESVVVEKSLTIRGQPDAVEALDCFASALPELATQEQAIVDSPGDTAVGFRLAANDAEVAGFVIQGGAIGVITSDRSADGAPLSGYRVHHNLIRFQRQITGPFGGYSVDLGAGGPNESRVDHNCFRDNLRLDGREGWGLATDLGDVIDARMDHNSSYRLTVGVEVIGVGVHERLTIDHNVSLGDIVSVALWTSAESAIAANESRGSRTVGIVVGGTNDGLQISGNEGRDGFQGIAFSNAFFAGRTSGPVTNVVVRENLVTGMAREGIVAGPGFLKSSLITMNMASGNGRDGIVLRSGNTDNVVSGNTADGNGWSGIRAQALTSGNRFEANQMHGNAIFDAQDEAYPANTWVGNSCETDFPAGAICAVG